jgi:hypothetical protein
MLSAMDPMLLGVGGNMGKLPLLRAGDSAPFKLPRVMFNPGTGDFGGLGAGEFAGRWLGRGLKGNPGLSKPGGALTYRVVVAVAAEAAETSDLAGLRRAVSRMTLALSRTSSLAANGTGGGASDGGMPGDAAVTFVMGRGTVGIGVCRGVAYSLTALFGADLLFFDLLRASSSMMATCSRALSSSALVRLLPRSISSAVSVASRPRSATISGGDANEPKFVCCEGGDRFDCVRFKGAGAVFRAAPNDARCPGVDERPLCFGGVGKFAPSRTKSEDTGVRREWRADSGGEATAAADVSAGIGCTAAGCILGEGAGGFGGSSVGGGEILA